MTEHEGAIEYDLITQTGHELKDVGRTLSWGALNSFIKYEKSDSALSLELNEDNYIWSTATKTNGILADIFDMLAQINANLVALAERRKANQIDRYPRPGVESTKTKHYGNSSMPIDEMRQWIEQRRRKHVGND